MFGIKRVRTARLCAWALAAIIGFKHIFFTKKPNLACFIIFTAALCAGTSNIIRVIFLSLLQFEKNGYYFKSTIIYSTNTFLWLIAAISERGCVINAMNSVVFIKKSLLVQKTIGFMGKKKLNSVILVGFVVFSP